MEDVGAKERLAQAAASHLEQAGHRTYQGARGERRAQAELGGALAHSHSHSLSLSLFLHVHHHSLSLSTIYISFHNETNARLLQTLETELKEKDKRVSALQGVLKKELIRNDADAEVARHSMAQIKGLELKCMAAEKVRARVCVRV